MFGFFNVNKPAGPTSHDVVALIRRGLGRGIKIGHAGTLDPFAAGVLVICVGPATRLADYVQRRQKRYLATIRLGATSTSDDPEGTVTETGCAMPPEDVVRRTLQQFVGLISQVPPAHSAVLVGGRRAYKLARRGKAPVLSPREVIIHSIDLVRYEGCRLDIDVACGSGTYVRALARDIGQALGVGGYCTGLLRTAVGPFTLEAAVAPERIEPARDLLSPLQALADMPSVVVDDAAEPLLAKGRPVELNAHALRRNGLEDHPARQHDQLAVLNRQGELLALCRLSGETLLPTKVFIAE